MTRLKLIRNFPFWHEGSESDQDGIFDKISLFFLLLLLLLLFFVVAADFLGSFSRIVTLNII